MDDGYCTDCKKHTEMVFDHAAGDTICRECGAVMESWYIDQTAEYRTFQNDSERDYDPIRVGGPVNPLLAEARSLYTVVSKAPVKNSDGDDLSRLQSRTCRDHDHERLQASVSAIGDMADRMDLVKTIKDQACEMYIKLEDQKDSSVGKRNKDALMAACIYIACKKAHAPRSLIEISYLANGATKKAIGRAMIFVTKQLQIEIGECMEMETVQAGDYLKRFCSQLLMSKEEIKAVQETVQNLEVFDIRRNPKSKAAAVIFMISQLSDKSRKPSLGEISAVATVAEGTIKEAYKELFSYASRIIPEWFAKGKDLDRILSNPRKRNNSSAFHGNGDQVKVFSPGFPSMANSIRAAAMP